jgi:hypothetical protein
MINALNDQRNCSAKHYRGEDHRPHIDEVSLAHANAFHSTSVCRHSSRPWLELGRKPSSFFEAQYVLGRIGHDLTKLFLRDDPWQFIISSRLMEPKTIVPIRR